MTDVEIVGGVLPDTISKYFECANNENWDPFPELWDEHALVSLSGMPPATGRDEIVDYYRALFAKFPQHIDEIKRAIVAGDTVVLEIRFEGTTLDARAIAFDAVDVFDLRDGRIQRLRGWFDTAEVNRLLGKRR